MKSLVLGFPTLVPATKTANKTRPTRKTRRTRPTRKTR
jgi:hypothetical protein